MRSGRATAANAGQVYSDLTKLRGINGHPVDLWRQVSKGMQVSVKNGGLK